MQGQSREQLIYCCADTDSRDEIGGRIQQTPAEYGHTQVIDSESWFVELSVPWADTVWIGQG